MASLKDLNVQFGEYIYAVGRTSRARRKRAQENKKSCKKARRHRHIGIDIASASDNRT